MSVIGRFRVLALVALLASCGDAGRDDAGATDVAQADAGDDTRLDAADGADGETDVAEDAAPDSSADVAADASSDTEGDADPDASADSGDAADTADPSDAADAGDTADVADTADASDAADTADAPDTPDTRDAADAAEDSDTAPDPGFGALSGACRVLDDELDDDAPWWFESAIDFGDDPFDDPEDRAQLSDGGVQILEEGNAGGSSLYSELFAYEILERCEGASLLYTERFVPYRPDYAGSITDLLVSIDDVRIGVSVTRAVRFPFDDPYPPSAADALLRDKLADVLESSGGVLAEAAWPKQILFVVAYDDAHVPVLRDAWEALPTDLRADTIVWVAATRGADAFLY